MHEQERIDTKEPRLNCQQKQILLTTPNIEVEIKLVVLARNFALSSNASLNFKYEFGPHRSPLLHQ